jgi:hypothetical protein
VDEFYSASLKRTLQLGELQNEGVEVNVSRRLHERWQYFLVPTIGVLYQYMPRLSHQLANIHSYLILPIHL